MSDEKKTCPYCGKTLRSDNTRGACSDCLAKGHAAVPLAKEESKRGGSKKRSDTMKSFRTVAAALGKDPDAILEEAASEWLSAVRRAVE